MFWYDYLSKLRSNFCILIHKSRQISLFIVMAHVSEKQLELLARRKKISELLGTCTIAEIASKLYISKSTVDRDIRGITKSVDQWLDDVAKYQFIHTYKLALERSAKRRQDLESELLQTTDRNHRLKLWQLIQTEEKIHLDTYSKVPVVHALRRASGGVTHVQ